MLVLIPILTATLIQPATADYKVVSVDRHEAYAGRLGQRVEQTVIAERDGKRYEIKLGRTHTAIRGSTKTYSAGDSLKVDWGMVVREQ